MRDMVFKMFQGAEEKKIGRDVVEINGTFRHSVRL